MDYRDPEWLNQRYWTDGLSTRQIAEQKGMDAETIRKWMKRHGIPRRTRSESLRGNKNPSWKGGRTYHSKGYIWIHRPDHPNADHHGYVLEHRLVMEDYVGRPLNAKEVVHHKNEVNNDNRLENLILFSSQGEHTRYHHGKGGYWENA